MYAKFNSFLNISFEDLLSPMYDIIFVFESLSQIFQTFIARFNEMLLKVDFCIKYVGKLTDRTNHQRFILYEQYIKLSW